MAGLNFVGNACYSHKHTDGDNILQSEFIPWILGQCTSVKEARQKLDRICMLSESFNDKLPVSSLHWIISDKEENITVEFMKDGLHIYDNPVGVLTNNPPFETQMFLLNQYMGLSASQPDNRFSGKVPLGLYSRGMGANRSAGRFKFHIKICKSTFVEAEFNSRRERKRMRKPVLPYHGHDYPAKRLLRGKKRRI